MKILLELFWIIILIGGFAFLIYALMQISKNSVLIGHNPNLWIITAIVFFPIGTILVYSYLNKKKKEIYGG